MQSVYKYTIPVEDYFSLDLPKGAKVLTLQEQHGEPQLWALVKKGASTEKRNFRLAGTGHPIKESPESLNYIGTFQLAGGGFIGHVFKLSREKNNPVVQQGAINQGCLFFFGLKKFQKGYLKKEFVKQNFAQLVIMRNDLHNSYNNLYLIRNYDKL